MAEASRGQAQEGDRQRMNRIESLMTTVALLLALSLTAVVMVITATDLGWAGAFLFFAGFVFGLVSPRRG